MAISDASWPDTSSALHFAPIISLQSMVNVDICRKFGLFTGLAVQNVGYIYDNYSTFLTESVTSPIKKKFRSINICDLIGVKIGNLKSLFFFVGTKLNFRMYQEKPFNTAGETTDTDVYWFSKRTENIQQNWLVGIKFPYGMHVKFKLALLVVEHEFSYLLI